MRLTFRFHTATLATSLACALSVPAVSTAKPPAVRTASEVSLGPPGTASAVVHDPTPPPADRPRLRILPDPKATGRGHSFTDAGLDLPAAPPTALERVKLELARAAVEASRQAGTLFTAPREKPRATLRKPAPEDNLRLRARAPANLRADAAAGLAPDFQPIQLVGPPGLNAVELAKRSGTPLPVPSAVTPLRPNGERAAGDGAPKPSDPYVGRAPSHD